MEIVRSWEMPDLRAATSSIDLSSSWQQSGRQADRSCSSWRRRFHRRSRSHAQETYTHTAGITRVLSILACNMGRWVCCQCGYDNNIKHEYCQNFEVRQTLILGMFKRENKCADPSDKDKTHMRCRKKDKNGKEAGCYTLVVH